MEAGSPSWRSWADEAEDELPPPESLGAGFPGRFSDDFFGCGRGERISFTDSEDYSDSEPPSPPPAGKGKAVAEPAGQRRRAHRRRRKRQGQGDFMAAARRSHPQLDPAPPPARRRTPTAHPARPLEVPDADGFFQRPRTGNTAGGGAPSLFWRPWRRTSLASAQSFPFRVLVGMRRVPLHARNAATAQAILGPACAEVDVVRPSDVPADDDREFFVTAWCTHPRFIHDEQVVFIRATHSQPVEAALTVLRGCATVV
ncbi:unnamed protein product [Miscanthus lutarioriparius]|uniref:Uncharacterized protein n=1 Tax=Miscanthus lutarioriparius TaxID=422564 RepID=A0A811QCU8_9POAL|nr:unnamed protein product [Miscanthus lutarioriparius]